jgi:hypothetical protein
VARSRVDGLPQERADDAFCLEATLSKALLVRSKLRRCLVGRKATPTHRAGSTHQADARDASIYAFMNRKFAS